MDETEQLQRKMLAAARLRDAPDPAVFDRMRRNLMARIEVEDEEPAWREPAQDEDEEPSSRAWLWWTLGAAAAGTLLVALLGPSISREVAGDARDAAMFDHEDDSTQGQARDREPAARRSVGTRQGGSSARVLDEASSDVEAVDTVSQDQSVTPHAEDILAIAADDGASAEPEQGSSSSSPPESARRRVGSSRPPAARGAPSSSPSAAVATSDVAGEAAVLRQVQRALSRDDLDGAAAALEAYRKRFPQGALALEADGAAVIVACRKGEASATKRARRYLARHGASPLAARIRAACATESLD